jgi:carbamoyl-phosphate synthase small subunit
MKDKNKAILALEDGFALEGISFGAQGEAFGEVVFNTSMTGYQEILTDPSYKGQLVTMTYPLIGNYGINEEDVESIHPWVEGFIVKENSAIYSNWRAKSSLDDYLKKHNIIGISGIDTRSLTRRIRLQGAMKAVISSKDFDKKSLVRKAQESPGLVGADLVKDVTCEKSYEWNNDGRFKVVAMDFGVKHNILRLLALHDCQVKVVSAKTGTDQIRQLNPDGIFLSNGPADPAAVVYAIETVRDLIGRFPIFGICLGHQILGLAFGGKTYKLKFGHHGGNHPVMDLETGKVEITSQNHGFCVDIDSIPDKEVVLTHKNLYDGTVEGLKHRKLPIFSVQYHPEASPGPHDAGYLFKRFVDLMKREKNEREKS